MNERASDFKIFKEEKKKCPDERWEIRDQMFIQDIRTNMHFSLKKKNILD